MEPKRIVFFDGVCGLCNASVDWLLRADRREALLFSPLQGEAAREWIPKELRNRLETICFWDGARLHTRSSAALEILRALGGLWAWLYPLSAIPEDWRNAAYDLVASRRYRWFGRRTSCRLPTEQERRRFLD